MTVTYASFTGHGLMAVTSFVTDATTYPQAVVEQAIADANCLVGPNYWHNDCADCNRRDLAIIYLVAHRLTVMTQTGILGSSSSASGVAPGINPGTISSLSSSQGSQSVSWSNQQSNSSENSSLWKSEGSPPTYWWTQYLSLRGTRRAYVGFVA